MRLSPTIVRHILSAGMFCLGLLLLRDQFLVSGKDVIVLVLVAPVLCALSFVVFGATLRTHRRVRAWQRYLRDTEEGQSSRPGAMNP